MQSNLSQASVHLDEFEKGKNIDDLREALNVLDGISKSVEANVVPDAKQRDSVLVAWLRLLNLIDSSLNPSFNPNDVPAIGVLPPGAAGLQYGSGTKPEDVKDPVLREQFEALIEDNRKKTEAYALQTGLHRLNETATPEFIRFSRQCYSSKLMDRQDWQATVTKVIKDRKRATALKREFMRED